MTALPSLLPPLRRSIVTAIAVGISMLTQIVSAKEPAHVDRYGDPLPPGAIARLGTLRFRHGETVKQIAYSPDGKMLVSAAMDDAVYLWEASTGKQLRRLENATSGIDPGVAISPNGQMLATAANNKVRRWDLATGKELPAFPVKDVYAVGQLTFAANGKVLVCSGQQRSPGFSQNILLFLDFASGKELYRKVGLKNYIKPCLAFSPDSTTWAYTDHKDKHVRLYDIETGKEIRRFEGHLTAASTVAFSPDGKTLACPIGHSICLWDVATGKLFPPSRECRREIFSISLAADGRTLAAAGGDSGGLRFWDTATGQELRNKRIRDDIYAAAYSPDGRFLAVGAMNKPWKVGLLDAKTNKMIRKLKGPHYAGLLAFSADGKILAARHGGQAFLWDTATGKELRHIALGGSGGSPRVDMALSPDGKLLAYADESTGAIPLWDTNTGNVRRHLPGHERWTFAVAFSPDGTKLASCGYDETIRSWNVATGRELRHIPYSQRWGCS